MPILNQRCQPVGSLDVKSSTYWDEMNQYANTALLSSIVLGRVCGRGAKEPPLPGPYTLKHAVKFRSSFTDLLSPISKIKIIATWQ